MKIVTDHKDLFSYTPLNVPIHRIGCNDGTCLSFTLNGTAGSGDWGGWKFIGQPDKWQNPAPGPYQVQYDGHTFYLKYLGGVEGKAVPEPATGMVLGLLLCGMWALRRLRR